ncbi:MAG: hypothetical protein ACPGVK_02610 [Halocynthiibacter sp.]
MFTRLLGAFLRAIIVTMVLVVPTLSFPEEALGDEQLMSIVSLLFGVMVFFEYATKYPSFLEYCHAAPFNRLRASVLVVSMLAMVLVFSTLTVSSSAGTLVVWAGGAISSVVTVVVDPDTVFLWDFSHATSSAERAVAPVAVAAAWGVCAIGALLVMVYLSVIGWCAGNKRFDFYANLPMFTVSDDSLLPKMLRRSGYKCMLASLISPVLIPLTLYALYVQFGFNAAHSIQNMIWIGTVWAFVPMNFMLLAYSRFIVAAKMEIQLADLRDARARDQQSL